MASELGRLRDTEGWGEGCSSGSKAHSDSLTAPNPTPTPLMRALSTAGKLGKQAESGSSRLEGTKAGTVVAPENKGELRGSHPSECSTRPGSSPLPSRLRGTRASLGPLRCGKWVKNMCLCESECLNESPHTPRGDRSPRYGSVFAKAGSWQSMTAPLPPPSRVDYTRHPPPPRTLPHPTHSSPSGRHLNMGVRVLLHALLVGWGWWGATGKRAFSPSLPPSLAFLGTKGGLAVVPSPAPAAAPTVGTAGLCVSGS